MQIAIDFKRTRSILLSLKISAGIGPIQTGNEETGAGNAAGLFELSFLTPWSCCMKWKIPKLPWNWIRLALGLAILVAAGLTYSTWWPPLSGWIDDTMAGRRGHPATDEGEHASAEGSAAAPATVLDLSPQALRNLGLTSEFLRPIEVADYLRSVTVPAVVVPKPGRSQIFVTSPLNGVITHVHAVTGEAVKPGDLLFEIRLTYEDLVETQTQYLKSISELEVENREIIRLEEATQSGAISGKSLLERRYAKEKLEALLRSQREGLRLHGLSDRQIDAIGTDGKLLRDLKIVAPDIDRHGDEEMRLSQNVIHRVSFGGHGGTSQDESSNPKSLEVSPGKLLVIDELQVHKGQAVVAGEKLCSLSDYSNLFIEGKAFEQNVAELSQASARGWKVDAVFPGQDGLKVVNGLKLAFVGNSIDPESRTLSFFVELPNEVLRDETNTEGQHFVAWRYRLGQRLEIRVPVEQWENQIVLPVDAVVKDGADWFVFQQNGTKFNRVPVHIQHRDQTSVVIANDGSIYPGDVIATKSAHQMQMAVKNNSGGAVDPHAGHNH